MIIICYDFKDDKVRARFSKFLKQYGRKVQYSVYEIRNSSRVLKNITDEIELKYKKQFKGSDSILIFRVCDGCKNKIIRYGYPAYEEEEVIIFE